MYSTQLKIGPYFYVFNFQVLLTLKWSLCYSMAYVVSSQWEKSYDHTFYSIQKLCFYQWFLYGIDFDIYIHNIPDLILRLNVHAINTITMSIRMKIATDTPIRIGRFFSWSQSTDVWGSAITADFVVVVVATDIAVVAVDMTESSFVVVVLALGVIGTSISSRKWRIFTDNG